MKVYTQILKKLEKEKLHFTLLDPDYDSAEKVAKMAEKAEKVGTDAIMVGGSTGLSLEMVDKVVRQIKTRCSLPVILFPTNAGTLSPNADAIFFMSMLNSSDLRYVIGEQVKGAPLVKKLGIEPIPMAYLVVEPGMAAGRVGKARLIRRKVPVEASHFALAGEYLGMRFIYLEAGSGAPEPVPSEMIKITKKVVSVPLIVGGGIRTPEQAKIVAESGADIVVTGTVVEESGASSSLLSEIIRAVKGVNINISKI